MRSQRSLRGITPAGGNYTHVALPLQQYSRTITMDLQLTGKKALVTGGTAGIGFAIAQALANEGAAVSITGRSQKKLDEAVAEIGKGKQQGSVAGILADLGAKQGADQLFDALPEVDILVNNLGIYETKQFGEITDEDWLKIFEVNVLSGVRTARQYFPKMLKKNWGRIIFVSSESSVMIPPDMIHYGMTKTAQLSIARGLAETTKGTGVTVNTLLPGPTQSEGIVEFLKKLASHPDATPAEAEAEFFAKYRSESLLQRLIDPKEIGSLAAYLASPLSSATNGAALRVEGGLVRFIA
jgi:NAD(P)-dependent dehydrogenase (short-subunit alcohol dehydrogenase family)